MQSNEAGTKNTTVSGKGFTNPAMTELYSVTPDDAVDRYLNSREADDGTASKTVRNHRYNLKKFRMWAEETGFEDMSNMNGLVADDYKTWVMNLTKKNGDLLRPMTRQNIITTFRTFLLHCEKLEIVRSGVADKVIVPSVNEEDEVRNGRIPEETAHEILDYLRQFKYGSRKHVVFELLWHTGIRRGTLHGLDLDDWKPQKPSLQLHHRPDTETPLKNGKKGERHVYISDERVVNAISDYIKHNRYDVTDDYERKPLITTRQGRLSTTAITKNVYTVTRPCYYATSDCTCDSGELNENASKCEQSVSAHIIRKSSVTAQLNADIPTDVVGERTNMSRETLDKHYDQRSNEEQMDVRKQHLEDF